MKTLKRKFYKYQASSLYREHIKNNVLFVGLILLFLADAYLNTLILEG
jgi:hypothetical protein